jgi:hypothetical protein
VIILLHEGTTALLEENILHPVESMDRPEDAVIKITVPEGTEILATIADEVDQGDSMDLAVGDSEAVGLEEDEIENEVLRQNDHEDLPQISLEWCPLTNEYVD